MIRLYLDGAAVARDRPFTCSPIRGGPSVKVLSFSVESDLKAWRLSDRTLKIGKVWLRCLGIGRGAVELQWYSAQQLLYKAEVLIINSSITSNPLQTLSFANSLAPGPSNSFCCPIVNSLQPTSSFHIHPTMAVRAQFENSNEYAQFPRQREWIEN